MDVDLKTIVEHDLNDDCPVCRTQDIVEMALIPAASAWELANGLPRYAIAFHGAAGLLGAVMNEGVSREDVETVLAQLLDEIEAQITEDQMMGGPPQGTA